MSDPTTRTTAAQRRCPWCRQYVRPVKVSDRLVYPVHSRFVQDRIEACSGSGEVVDDV